MNHLRDLESKLDFTMDVKSNIVHDTRQYMTQIGMEPVRNSSIFIFANGRYDDMPSLKIEGMRPDREK